MIYCSQCGSELLQDANFCANCGVRTRKGIEQGVPIPPEWWKDSLSQAGQEVEKALSAATKEVEKALQTLRDKLHESTGGKPVICAKCGVKNQPNAKFCIKCGHVLT